MSSFKRGFLAALLVGFFGTSVAMAQTVAIYAGAAAPGLPDVQAKVTAAGDFDSVDAFNIDTKNLPTVSDLKAYDAVLVFSNDDFVYPVALGDVLADYVDSGGGVVIATFSFDSNVNDGGLQGRLATTGYLPFTLGPNNIASGLSLVPLIPSHPLLDGVTAFNGGDNSYHHAGIDFISGSEQVADWSNGEPLIGALRQSGGGIVVGLNFYPPSGDLASVFWDPETDGDVLMANALLYAAGVGNAGVTSRQDLRDQVLGQYLGVLQEAIVAFCESRDDRRPNPRFYADLCNGKGD